MPAKHIYAHTEAHHPLPGFVNVSRAPGGDVVFAVRGRGEDYAKTICVPPAVAQALADALAAELKPATKP